MLFGNKKQAVDDSNALVEMYKAGFLDGYKIKKNIRSNEAFKILNEFYKKAFMKRFGNKISKMLKEK